MNSNKIAVLVDSGCDVPAEVAKRYDIKVLPLKVIYANMEYSDGIDITTQDVFDRLHQEIPTTSLPSGEEIIHTLDKIKEQGYEKVIAVCISGGLSGTYNLMRMLLEDYKGLTCKVIDTKNISIGSGIIAIQAAAFADEGMGWEDLLLKVNGLVENSRVFFYVDTLEYLHKGGRIGLVGALFGSLLKIKPIISCNDEGVYFTVSKARGKKQAIEKLIQHAVDYANGCTKCMTAVVNAAAKQAADSISETLKTRIQNISSSLDLDLGPALAVHVGPGLLGICILRIQD